MQIETEIQGEPCLIEVTYYRPASPMRITGMGFGDAEAPVDEDFEYQVLDLDGEPNPDLETIMSPDDEERIARLIRDLMNARPEP